MDFLRSSFLHFSWNSAILPGGPTEIYLKDASGIFELSFEEILEDFQRNWLAEKINRRYSIVGIAEESSGETAERNL